MTKSLAIIGPHAEEYSLAKVNRELAWSLRKLSIEEGLGWDVKVTADERTVARTPNKHDYENYPYLKELYEVYDPNKIWDLAIYNNFPKDPNALHGLGKINATIKAAYIAWEEDRLPERWVAEYNKNLHVVFAATLHTQKVLQRSGVKLPIIVIPNALGDVFFRAVSEAGANQSKYIATSKSFKFFHNSTGIDRKAPIELVQAFCEEFTSDDDVALVIKSFPNANNKFKDAIAQFAGKKSSPEIEYIEKSDLTDAEMVELYSTCQVYLSPSKAEGFNLPALEAMHLGLPTITTGWSGQMDFCNDENSILIDYNLVPAQSHLDNPGAFWAQPDVPDLSRQMRFVFENYKKEKIEKLVENAHTTAKEYNWDNSAAELATVLPKLNSLRKAREIKLGVITPYNIADGIAEYSNYLYRHIEKTVGELKFIANKDATGRINVDSDNVVRHWEYGETNFSDVLSYLDKNDFNTIHIQYSESFYTLGALMELVDGLKALDITTILTAHAFQVEGVDFSEISKELSKLDQIQVLNTKDEDFLRNLGLTNVIHIPHGNITLPLQSKRLLRKRMRLENHSPIIAGHGFMSEGKGIIETIEAIRILKEEHPNLLYLAINAVNPRNMTSVGIRDKFLNKVEEFGLADNVIHIGNFLEQEEVITLLALADFSIFAYPEAKQTASGAVKLAMAAGRPIITTDSFQLSDMKGIAYSINDNNPESIVSAAKELLSNPYMYSKYLNTVLKAKGEASWEKVSLSYLHFLTNLHLES